jgi:outer membrane protein assembly factor BamE
MVFRSEGELKSGYSCQAREGWAIIVGNICNGNARPISDLPEYARRAIPVSLNRVFILVVVLLAGCSRVPILPGLTPYRMDIQQGNYVTQDMVSKLKPGMSKAQVRFALGTPLIIDPFHADRWDYIYLFQKRGRTAEHRRLIVLFQDDKLLRLEGDVQPAENNAGAERTPAAAVTSSP